MKGIKKRNLILIIIKINVNNNIKIIKLIITYYYKNLIFKLIENKSIIK